jgi:hypothetical protein
MAFNLSKAKLKSKDQLLARVWRSIGFVLFSALHARSRLFMAILMGQFYLALFAQALLVFFQIMCRDVRVL